MTWHEKLLKARLALPGRPKQRALDAMLGLRQGTIGEYENGRRVKNPPPHFLSRWDEILGDQIPSDWIVNGRDDPPPNQPARVIVAEQKAQYGDLDVKGLFADLVTGIPLGVKKPIAYAGYMPALSVPSDQSGATIEVDPKYAGEGRIAHRIRGNECHPLLRQGDLTIWDPDPAAGTHVIVRVISDLGRLAAREMLIDASTGAVSLRPLNDVTDLAPKDAEWAVTAKLVGLVRKFMGAEISLSAEDGLTKTHLLAWAPREESETDLP